VWVYGYVCVYVCVSVYKYLCEEGRGKVLDERHVVLLVRPASQVPAGLVCVGHSRVETCAWHGKALGV
jgi:hypothetical protein